MAYKTKRKKKTRPDTLENGYEPVDRQALSLYDKAARKPKQSAMSIIKLLQPIVDAGYPPLDVFIDFLRLSEVMLDELPRHVRSMRKTGQVDFTDPPEIEQFYAGLRERYPVEEKWIWGNMTAAVSILVFISPEVPQDTIGQIYARFVCPENKVIVPTFNEATKRAKKALGENPGRLIAAQMAEAGTRAAEDNPLAKSILETGLLAEQRAKTVLDDQWMQQFTRNNILPAILPHYEPVYIYDPALGSGTLMLAGSTLFPDWAVSTGMVQFKGADSDPLCVQMATVNAKIYGLNGYHIAANRALLPDELVESGSALFPATPDNIADCFRAIGDGDGDEPEDESEHSQDAPAHHISLF